VCAVLGQEGGEGHNHQVPGNGRSNGAAELLDVGAVAALLSCSVRSVWRLSDAGKMPTPVRVGRLVRWSHTALISWIGQGCPAVRVVT